MSLIQIKYSAVSDVPPSLAIGELAYSEKSKKLFIGKTGGIVAQIGGDDIVSRVGSLESTVVLLQTEIAALAGAGGINLGSLESRVTAIETAITNIASYDDTAIKQRLSTVEADLAKIKSDLSGQLSVHDLTVTGDLVVSGQVTTINSTISTIEDPVIRLGMNTPSSQDAMDRGIEYKWYDSVSGTVKTGFFGVDQSDGKFKFIPVASTNVDNVYEGQVGTIVANVEGSASKLTVARKIALSGDITAEVSFDGSADVSLNTVISVINGGTF